MSSINKINYEQFAMDYLEGNLSGDLLQEMNAFLEKNPVIKKELDEMNLFYLEADESIVFEEKEALLKPVPTRRIFLIAGCLLVCTLISALFLMDNKNDIINNENGIAVERDNIIDDNEKNVIDENTNEVVDNENKIVEQVKKEEPAVIEKKVEKIIRKETENNDNPNIEPPIQSPKKEWSEDQPIANNKPDENPIHQEKPTIEAPKNIQPIIPLVNDNQPVVKIEQPQEPTSTREVAMIASIELAPIKKSLDEGIQLENTIAVTSEIAEPEKQSRLARMGLIPERERKRKITFKTIKEALIPEGFASRE